ncbi:MAG: DUF4145 domain-containing protein [Candidatus Lokiarchaeota archaeon]|nr:DUF4145 domain-containing protein [Candidatus Lokiarchaeota archaeon]
MYQIPNEFISNWSTINNVKVPTTVDIICPYCHRKITFTLTSWNQNIQTDIFFNSSKCPSCREVARFFVFEYNEDDKKASKIFLYPTPKIRFPLSGASSAKDFSKELYRVYQSSINVYNTAEWSGTAVLCRKLLEGITKTLLLEQQQSLSLYQQLKALPQNVDLAKPILTLADAIRKAGNLGAHFDLEKEPNELVATQLLDLIDYLIEYLFVLPTKIEELNNSINNLNNS